MKKNRIFLAAISLLLIFSFCACGGQQEQAGLESSDVTAEETADTETVAVSSVVATTADYFLNMSAQLAVGDDDWVIIALARSGEEIPEGLFDTYYAQLEQKLTDSAGVLDETKMTEYFRTAVLVTAMGKDPQNVAGYNLLAPAADFEKTCAQGLNGPIWALIALNCGGYEMPAAIDASTAATKEMYIQHILSSQMEGGGYSLSGGEADVDMTAMAIYALSFYMDREDVASSVNSALSYLSSVQDEEGGFALMGEANIESSAQVLTAMAALNIPLDDERFVKNGNTVFDNMMSYSLDNGTFMHSTALGTEDRMATEQAFLAAVALERMEKGEPFLYDMN